MSKELKKKIVQNASNGIENKDGGRIEEFRASHKKNRRSSTSDDFRKNKLFYGNDVLSPAVDQGNADAATTRIDLLSTDRNHRCDNPSDFNQIQDTSRVSNKVDRNRPIDVNRHNCNDDCLCKIKQAVTLIIEEIKKVDTAINVLATKEACSYTPNLDDRKKFAKSVQKSSSVCYTMIEELKNQRAEINEMLPMYRASSDNFAQLETTLNHQREKIKHVKTILESVEENVKNVRIDVTERHENFLTEMRRRQARTETREEILKTFVDWISSLDAKRREESQKFDLHVEQAIAERNEDRTLLTLAVEQLQEVREIENLINAQHSTNPHGIVIRSSNC